MYMSKEINDTNKELYMPNTTTAKHLRRIEEDIEEGKNLSEKYTIKNISEAFKRK